MSGFSALLAQPAPERSSPREFKLPKRVAREGFNKHRLEAFSDAVFAIAITLLVIEVRVPEVEDGESLIRALAEQWPQYVAYAVSFTMIGIIWLNHHHVFNEVEAVSRGIALLNLFLLSSVAFLPFPTALLAEYARAGGAQAHQAAAVYSATMLAMSLWFMVLWRYIVRLRVHDPSIDSAGIRRRTRRASAAPLVYLGTVALSFVSAPLVIALHAAIAISYSFDLVTPEGDSRSTHAAM